MLLDFCLKLDLLNPIVSNLLFKKLQVALTSKHLVLDTPDFFVKGIDLRQILVVKLVLTGLAFLSISLNTFLVTGDEGIERLLDMKQLVFFNRNLVPDPVILTPAHILIVGPTILLALLEQHESFFVSELQILR